MPGASEHPASVLASAGTFANLRNAEGSLRFESSAMVERALAELATKKGCSTTACAAEKLAVRFSSTPHKVKEQYSEKEECAKHFERTSTQALTFPTQEFDDSTALSDWIGEFSQGKGALGADLYERCPGSCSPRFTYDIQQGAESETLRLRPSVVCGHARDKSDNQYELAYELVCLE